MAQLMDAYCKEAAAAITGIPGSNFSYDQSGILILGSAVHNAIQKAGTSNASGHSPLAGSPHLVSRTPCERDMYATLRWKYYWPHIINGVHQTVKDCPTCPNENTDYHSQRHLNLFLATGRLELVAIDIAAPFLEPSQSNQFVVLITNHYTKLPRAIQRCNKTSLHVVLIFFSH